MSIVSSVIQAIEPQIDGRRWVREQYTDQLGINYIRNRLATAIEDLQTALTAETTQLGTDLTNGEIAANVAAVTANGSLAVLTFNYSTALQGRTALRQAYLTATQVQAIMIGDFLSSLTDVQLENLFSMTQAQVTTLRTNKLTPAATAATAIRAASGV